MVNYKTRIVWLYGYVRQSHIYIYIDAYTYRYIYIYIYIYIQREYKTLDMFCSVLVIKHVRTLFV